VQTTDDPNKGKLAITHYSVLGKSKKHCFVKYTLETGKKNQIRVQSSHAGNPLSGDKKYGAVGNVLKRLCLHAYSIAFTHPVTGKKLEFTSPIPEAFYKLVKPKIS
jgi:tRNA pseudouridine32 synthase/23S rRNA pseudouridine746 synthase/23S rRNA pseudouridine1911/1915/1917 synthase